MTHTHTYKRDTSRTHGAAGRFFVVCACGDKAQAVMNSGYLHVFRTNKYRGGSKVISTRVTDAEYDQYKMDRAKFRKEVKKILTTRTKEKLAARRRVTNRPRTANANILPNK